MPIEIENRKSPIINQGQDALAPCVLRFRGYQQPWGTTSARTACSRRIKRTTAILFSVSCVLYSTLSPADSPKAINALFFQKNAQLCLTSCSGIGYIVVIAWRSGCEPLHDVSQAPPPSQEAGFKDNQPQVERKMMIHFSHTPHIERAATERTAMGALAG